MNFNSTLDAIPELPEVETPSPPPENGNAGSNVSTSRTSRAGKKRESLALEKLDSLKHLIQTVDTLIYTELFILYYMDCSFFRLLIRGFAQLILFSPLGPRGTPLTVDRPYMSGILVPNVLCLLLHVFTARPEAGETMRGYLHGGIIMDLIGQKGPTSKIHLLLLDLLVLALQCFMLSVNTKYKVLHFYIKNKEYRNPSAPEATAGRVDQGRPDAIRRELLAESTHQDHDAEERGVFSLAGITSDDVELHDISHRTTNPRDPENAVENGENGSEDEQHGLLGDHLLQNPRSREDELEEWLNLHHAGIATTAEFHILHCLRNQYQTYKPRAEMLQATATAFSSGDQTRTSRLASVSDILARAMEPETQNND